MNLVQPPSPDWRAPSGFFLPLQRNLSFVVVFVLAAALSALGLTYVYSERYEAQVAIEYRPQEIIRLRAPEAQSFGSAVPAPPFKVISQTLQELVGSEAIMARIVAEFDLTRVERQYSGPWWRVWFAQTKDWLRDELGDLWTVLKHGRLIEQDPVEGAIGDLRNNVRLRNRDSYVFALTVRDKSPERAAAIANRIAEMLIDKLRQSERVPGAAKLDQLNALLQTKAGEIAALRQSVESLLRRHQLVSLSTEIERSAERESALALDLSKLDADIARARERLSQVAQKQAQKRQLASGLAGGPATAAPAAAPAEPGGLPISPDDFRRLASERVFDEVELNGLLAKRSALQASLQDLQQRLRQLPDVQTQLDAQRMRLAAAERDYVQYTDAAAEASVRAGAVLSEVNLLHAARAPSQPIGPIKVYHVALAGLLGLLVGIGLVYLLSYFNVRVFFASRGWRARRAAASAPAASDAQAEPHAHAG